ncbi:MAG: carbohydrate ABC transporter permease [Polyangiaceae bacterium]|nr:carbohydrate ABC transporter permease [Polyangiaceae bacterium]
MTSRSRAGLVLAVIAGASFCIGPFGLQAITSLTHDSDLSHPGLPGALTLDHYKSAVHEQPFAHIVRNSLVVASAVTLASLAIAAPAAFAIAKLRVRGKSVLLGATLAISMFPPIATVSPLYLALRRVGLLDTLPGLTIPYTTFALPLALWILTGFFQDIPSELYLAARVDGCSMFSAFRKVLLPLAMPGIATAAILTFIFAYNEFLYALTFLSSPDKRTIPVAISLFAGEHTEPWGEIAAASTLATLPLVIVAIIFQRKIVSALTAGSVKG